MQVLKNTLRVALRNTVENMQQAINPNGPIGLVDEVVPGSTEDRERRTKRRGPGGTGSQ